MDICPQVFTVIWADAEGEETINPFQDFGIIQNANTNRVCMTWLLYLSIKPKIKLTIKDEA